MKIKLIVTILLLVFVAASLAALFIKGNGGPESVKDASLAAETDSEAAGTRIIAYYFHGNARCKTCLTIEMYALEALETGFPEALKRNRLDFQPVNIELPENEHFIDDFQLAARTVVLQKIVDGKPGDYLNLHRVWELVGDKEAYIAYIQEETEKFMNGES